jgi:hypothetical protein
MVAAQIPILEAQVEHLKKDKEETEKNKKEAEDMFLIITENFDKLGKSQPQTPSRS